MLIKTLQYAFYRSKERLRVHIIRKLRRKSVQGKVEYVSQSVGSFKLYDKNKHHVELAILDSNLSPQEQIELREFLYAAHFGKLYFNEEVDNFSRDILRLPTNFLQTIMEASVLAHEHGLAFNAHQIMFEALMAAIQRLEHELTIQLGQPVNLLKKNHYQEPVSPIAKQSDD